MANRLVPQKIERGYDSSYKDLRVWKQSFDLTLEIYRQTKNFAKDEPYGLTSQLRGRSYR